MDRKILDEEALEQATGGESSFQPVILFDIQVTGQDTAESLRVKISQAKSDLTADQVNEIVENAMLWMGMGEYGTYVVRISHSHINVGIRA